MRVNMIWSTPDGDQLLAYMARVSNPKNQDNAATAPKLIGYLIRNAHWSPFEMVNACMEIECSRDISRQILRHRSFSFQEFSQRYATVQNAPIIREPRLQHPTNRQASTETADEELLCWFAEAQNQVWDTAIAKYLDAIEKGIAKEQARALLPEGMAPTRMYMNGTLRSWIHFHKVRTDLSAQKEVREVAHAAGAALSKVFPSTWKALTE